MNYFLLLLFIAATQGSQTKRFKRVVRIDKNNDTTVQDDGKTKCFSYTWLANEDADLFAPYLNKSCSDRYAKDKPNMRLCRNPMVVTDNGNEPDHELLYVNYPQTTCKLQRGQTCVKYIYRFNGKIENITRYCSQVTVDEIPMETGCVVSDFGSGETEVCACNKMVGNMPCNGSAQLGFVIGLISLMLINLFT